MPSVVNQKHRACNVGDGRDAIFAEIASCVPDRFSCFARTPPVRRGRRRKLSPKTSGSSASRVPRASFWVLNPVARCVSFKYCSLFRSHRGVRVYFITTLPIIAQAAAAGNILNSTRFGCRARTHPVVLFVWNVPEGAAMSACETLFRWVGWSSKLCPKNERVASTVKDSSERLRFDELE